MIQTVFFVDISLDVMIGYVNGRSYLKVNEVKIL